MANVMYIDTFICIITPRVIDMTSKEIWLVKRSHVEGEQIVVFPSRRRVSLSCLTAQRSALYNVVLQLSV